MTPMRRFLLLLLFIAIGVGFGIGFGAIFYTIRKKEDEQISLSGSINEIITPSIAFWVAVGIIILLKIEYCIPMKILVMSGIILAGFLSAISSKKAWLFFLCFGVVVLELGLEALIRRFVDWVNCTNEKRKAKMIIEAANNIIAPPEPSQLPVNNSSQLSAPPVPDPENKT